MSSSPERFADEDAEAQHWLGILKDGPNHRKVEARLALARIFERRGMPDEAIELLVSSIGAGHRDPDAYESLGRLYAAHGRPDLSVRARAEAQQLRIKRQREQAAAEAQQLAQTQTAGVPMNIRESRRRGFGYMAAGLLVTVGGFIFAATYEGGVHIILYALPIVGVAVFLRGLAAMFPRDVTR
jgi:hypothetical protein